MKKVITFLTMFVISANIYSQINCTYKSNDTINFSPNALLKSGNCISNNGYCHTPKGNLHIMFVFVVFNNEPSDQNSFWWPESGIPNFAKLNGLPNNLLDISPNNPTNINNLTTWYRAMSGGRFTITGEIFKVSIDRIFKTDGSLHFREMTTKVFEQLELQLQNRDLSVFDQRENNPFWNFDNSRFKSDGTPAGGDGIIDYLVMNWRLPSSSGIAGGAAPLMYNLNTWKITTNYNNTVRTYRANAGHEAITIMDELPHKQFFTHEFAHNLYDASHYMGANTLPGQHFFTHKGWGMMSYLASMHTSNAWEKWILGWIDMTNRTITSNTMGIVLKDFVTNNDAIRIPIPNTNPQQYLWLENHQKINPLDDKLFYTNNLMGKGIYAFINSNGSDCNNPSSFTFDYDATTTNIFKVLTRRGNNDYTYTTYLSGLPSFSTVSDNPFSGENNFTMIRKNFNNNDVIEYCKDANHHTPPICTNEQQYLQVEDGVLTESFSGTTQDPFQLGDEISINGIIPAVNYPTYNDLNNQLNDYLVNGIKVKIRSYDPISGEYIVDVSFDELSLKENKRWASFITLPNITNNNNPDLIINSGKTLTINKSGTVNTTTKGPNSEYPDFIKPTVFTCKSNSYLKMEPYSTIIVDENSTINMEGGSIIEVNDGAVLLLKNGSKLNITESSRLIVNGTGQLIIEAGAALVYHPNAIIDLRHPASHIELKQNGKIELQKMQLLLG